MGKAMVRDTEMLAIGEQEEEDWGGEEVDAGVPTRLRGLSPPTFRHLQMALV